ncbi:hypothetical protein EDB81DRAFT_168814 [Dactylonectria macrodidyma]|uniref:Uncharacterized protein n=1 Tax=Dactylonectria macrodidyma TaxID=307937 RepID=A0A9P9JLH4_9HYPO|nr:hypothetical protein EDB81DRAFT_168814 [Dactylonectria macrodidyma]
MHFQILKRISSPAIAPLSVALFRLVPGVSTTGCLTIGVHIRMRFRPISFSARQTNGHEWFQGDALGDTLCWHTDQPQDASRFPYQTHCPADQTQATHRGRHSTSIHLGISPTLSANVDGLDCILVNLQNLGFASWDTLEHPCSNVPATGTPAHLARRISIPPFHARTNNCCTLSVAAGRITMLCRPARSVRPFVVRHLPIHVLVYIAILLLPAVDNTLTSNFPAASCCM